MRIIGYLMIFTILTAIASAGSDKKKAEQGDVFNADDWIKAKQSRKLPQWVDVVERMRFQTDEHEYDSLRFEFFNEVLWPAVKKAGAFDTQKMATQTAFFEEFPYRKAKSYIGKRSKSGDQSR